MFQDFESPSKSEWKAKAENDLKGKPLQKLHWKTFEGLELAPYYNAEDLAENSSKTLLPGQSPFLRSHKELGNGWLVRECISKHKNFTATNAKALEAVEQGAHNLSFEILASEEGFRGIPVKNEGDLTQLLLGIDVQETGISFQSGNTGPFYFKLLCDWATSKSADTSQIFGSIDYDPIAQYLVEGTSSKNLDSLFDDLKELLQYASGKAPYYKILSLQSSAFHNTGASIVQELAFSLSLAHEYIHQLESRELAFEDFYSQLQIELSTGGSYFQEIAKVRAMRWLWTSLTSEYSKNEQTQACYIVGRTSQWNKSVYDPHVNMLRLTTEAMSMSIGGMDEVQIDGYDKTFRSTNAFSERISRNLHHLLTHESYIDKSIDAASGSYYIEMLTEQLATEAWKLFQLVEEKGGLLAVSKSGWLQEQLGNSRKNREERLSKRKEKFIGVNEFPNPEDDVFNNISSSGPAVPYFNEEEAKSLDFSSITEIGQYIQYQFKEQKDSCQKLNHYVATEAFEQLRANTEAARKEGRSTSSFFLMPLGNKSMRTARANFALNFFQCGGYQVHNHPGFETVEEAVEQFKQQKSTAAVICSSDAEYEALIPQIGKALKQSGLSPTLILAGYPGDKKEDYEDMGIEDFIYAGCNVYDILKGYVK